MDKSQGSSSSVANSAFRGNCSYEVSDVPCFCKKPAIIFKAWTNENPGRRFYKCGGKLNGVNVPCEFWKWADEEKPHGWQKVSLLEARDQIRQQKEELKMLKDELKMVKAGLQNVNLEAYEIEMTDSVLKFEEAKRAFEMELAGNLKKFEEEKRALENAAMAAKEREKMLSQCLVISWGGFIVLTALILNMAN